MLATTTARRLSERAERCAPCDGRERPLGSGPTLEVLFLTSAHNSLSQRIWVELTELGHEVTVVVVGSGREMELAVAEHRPQLIVCPMLKTVIPESVWSEHRCLVVHPGPLGDRGASSLDWAIELEAERWGVTVIQATDELDGGDVWATRTFDMRPAGKSSLYRHEVRHAATAAILEAVAKILEDLAPDPVDASSPAVTGTSRPPMTQSVRAIQWSRDSTETVLRKLRAAEGHPGVLDTVCGVEAFLFGGHRERGLRGRPGEIIASRAGAICRATVDGAVWITHLKRRDNDSETFFKLPATRALSLAGAELDAPEVPVAFDAAIASDDTYRDITYREHAGVGYLNFDFYNGAMSTEQCRRLRDAYLEARSRSQTRVIVLTGGRDFFSNGIHLNVIEAAANPALESWRNLNAIDDLVREIINTDSHLVISALRGDAAAGGVPLALAADLAFARRDVVLNPYYEHMGGLYGSEYWTYLLPRRVGAGVAARLTVAPFTALGASGAVKIGLLDGAFGTTPAAFGLVVGQVAADLAADAELADRLAAKRRRRARDEAARPLEDHRRAELERCHECFFGHDRSYHHARHRFVHKLGPVCATPRTPAVSH